MRKYLFFMTVLLIIGESLFAASVDYGRPVSAYSPSTVNNAWLNGSTVFHPDEFAYAGIAYRMLVKKQLVPSYYHNPSLNIYTDLAIFGLSGALALPHNATYGDREIAPFSLYVMGRYLSALFSLISAALVYAIGRLVFSRKVGLLAAAVFVLSPLTVQHAHYATPNAETITCMLAALFAGVVILRQQYPSRLAYALGGLSVGLTAGARYNAVIVGMITVFAMLTAWRKHRRWRLVALGLVAIPIGFLIAVPGAILERRKFISDFFQILDMYKNLGGGPGWTAPNSLSGMYYHWRYTILFATGPLVTVLAVLGLGLIVYRGSRNKSLWRQTWFGVLVFLFLIVYTLIALPGSKLNANLLLPLIAPLALLAGYCLEQAQAVLAKRLSPVISNLCVGLLLFLAIAPLSVFTGNFLYLIGTLDNRLQAQAWIYQHLPKGETIYLLGSYNVPLDPLDYNTVIIYSPSISPDKPIPSDARFIVYSDTWEWVTLRDLTLSPNPNDVNTVNNTTAALKNGWQEIASFPRMYWVGQDIPPDDVSYWHQMGITIYCKSDACPKVSK